MQLHTGPHRSSSARNLRHEARLRVLSLRTIPKQWQIVLAALVFGGLLVVVFYTQSTSSRPSSGSTGGRKSGLFSAQSIISSRFAQAFPAAACSKPQPRRSSPPEQYMREPTFSNSSYLVYKQKLHAYLDSTAFQLARSQVALESKHENGIVICTGGGYYLTQAVVLLRILRHNMKSTLPVQLVWAEASEMTPDMFSALQEAFGPLYGTDASNVAPAEHHMPGARLKGFAVKTFAILHAPFKNILLLDCDVVLNRDPSYLFDSPMFKEHGNVFWSDIYPANDGYGGVLEMVGLDSKVQPLLDQGRGGVYNRWVESGQFLISRQRHLDVLEWAWLLNCFGHNQLYNYTLGDKDAYALAFALAGKPHEFNQACYPPAGIYTHRDHLKWEPTKEQMNRQGNWWLHALVHYDNDGEIILHHRVTGEIFLAWDAPPTDELITPPLPAWWTVYHMGNAPSDTMQDSFQVADVNVTELILEAPPHERCPLAAWGWYWHLRTHGIDVARNLTLERTCAPLVAAAYDVPESDLQGHFFDNLMRVGIDAAWEREGDPGHGWPRVPKHPLLAVPVNMTASHSMWLNLNAAFLWMKANLGSFPMLKNP